MQEFIENIYHIAAHYNVNPVVFAGIYIGAIPFFTGSVAWLVRNIRKSKSIFLPLICAGFTFLSAYIYLIIVGKGVPFWVYLLISILVLYGAYTTYRKIRKDLDKKDDDI